MPFPVDERFLIETEAKLGVKFPPDYTRRMMQQNGGEVETFFDNWVLYPILDTSDRKRLQRTCNDVVSETASVRKWNGFPVDAVAIAGNGGGDQLILLPAKESPGRLSDEIYWWDHETGVIRSVASRFEDLCTGDDID